MVNYRSVEAYFNARKGKNNDQGFKKGYGAEGTNRNYVSQEMQRLLDNGFELSPESVQQNFEDLFEKFSAAYGNDSPDFWKNNKMGKMGETEFACLAIAMSDINAMRDAGQIDMDAYGEYMSRLFDPATIEGLMNSDKNNPAASADFLTLVSDISTAREDLPENQYDNSQALPYGTRDIVNDVNDYSENHELRDQQAHMDDPNYNYMYTRRDVMSQQQNTEDVMNIVREWTDAGLLPEGTDAEELRNFVTYSLAPAATGGYMQGEYNGQEYGVWPASMASLTYAMMDINSIEDPDVKAAMIANIANPEAMMQIVAGDPAGVQFLSDLDLCVQNPELFAAEFSGDTVDNSPMPEGQEGGEQPAVEDDNQPAVEDNNQPAAGGHADNGAVYDAEEGFGHGPNGFDYDAVLQAGDIEILNQKAPSDRFGDLQAAALEYYKNPTQDAAVTLADQFSEEEIGQIMDMAAYGQRNIENLTPEGWASRYYPGRTIDGLDSEFRSQQAEAAARIMTHEDSYDLGAQINHQIMQGTDFGVSDGSLISADDAKAIYEKAAGIVAGQFGEDPKSFDGLDGTTLGEAVVNTEMHLEQDVNGNGTVDHSYEAEEYEAGGDYGPDVDM